MCKSKLNYNHLCQKSNYCILMIPVCNSVQSRPISRQRGIHDWWVQISVSVQWIDIMCDHVFCWLFQEEMTKKMILMLAAVIPITPSSAMTPSKTSGYWLARWGTRKKLMPWQSWTETLLSIGATSDNWGRGQYGYDSKYQGVDTNHLYQHWRLRLWPVILPKWLNKNKKVNKNKLYTTAFTNQCFKCSNIHNLTKWLHITHYLLTM